MRCGKMVTLSPQSSLERWNGKAGNVDEVPRLQNRFCAGEEKPRSVLAKLTAGSTRFERLATRYLILGLGCLGRYELLELAVETSDGLPQYARRIDVSAFSHYQKDRIAQWVTRTSNTSY
jgi:hypothetical protein